MTDLVSELRVSAMPNTHVGDCMIRAADEITRLRELVKAAYVEGAVDWASNDAHLSIHVDFYESFLKTDAYRQLQGADTPQAEEKA